MANPHVCHFLLHLEALHFILPSPSSPDSWQLRPSHQAYVQTQAVSVSPETSHEAGEGKGERKRRWRLLMDMNGEAGNLRSALTDSSSLKQKGDWKDVALISFSFVAYVYNSEKIGSILPCLVVHEHAEIFTVWPPLF
ncbi:hypothetical protein BHE74_00029131 [Ensete ventricosum]|nr:hypothetical protein GW17_00008909 [Ensete ventricosum]RWW63675.1 hypothetical protein BHE74_00029131 [Ensete ventricosum]